MSMRIGIVNDLALAREALRRVVLAMPGQATVQVAAHSARARDTTGAGPW